jgi:hypothetical protein
MRERACSLLGRFVAAASLRDARLVTAAQVTPRTTLGWMCIVVLRIPFVHGTVGCRWWSGASFVWARIYRSCDV